MKKIIVFSLVLCLLLSFSVLFVSASPVDVTTPTDNTETTGSIEFAGDSNAPGIDAPIPVLGVEQISKNAKSMLVYEVNSDTLMYTYNPDSQLYPSSFVKILTALIAIEKGNLSDVVTVKESAVSSVPYNAVSAELKVGEQITLESLLYCMMVGSANDAAAVIAEHISGTQEAFITLMNERAMELGCTNTMFMNVHGLHHDEQLSTARDIGRILSVAVKNETFSKIFSTVHHTVSATNKSEIRDLATGNFLMNTDDMQIYFDERVTGGRTGVAQDGTRCLAASAEGNGMKLITVVMGAEDVVEDDGFTTTIYGGYKETTQLLDMCIKNYKAVMVLYPGQAVSQLDVIDGTNQVILGSNVSVSAVLPAKINLDNLTFRYSNTGEIKAPIAIGDMLSKVEIWNGNTCVATTDLFAMNAVKSVSQEQATLEKDDSDNGGKIVLIILIVVAAVVIIGFVAIRILPNIKNLLKKRRMKRFRRNRRRSR